MYKVKCYVLSLFSLISMYPYLSPAGWMVHIDCREKISLWHSIDHHYNIKLKDLRVIIDGRVFEDEKYEPETKTLYLGPTMLDNR